MANQKEIRKRISSVKNTQKITRAMKMVAGARLHRAQARIQAMRPYAVETGRVLRAVVQAEKGQADAAPLHPLLVRREERRIALVVITGDRGLCGAFNTNVLRRAESLIQSAEAAGKQVSLYTIGRKARDYFNRRKTKVSEHFSGVWENLSLEQARRIARALLRPFLAEEVDAIYVVYNEFKSAMTQQVVAEPLFPLSVPEQAADEGLTGSIEYLFEPDRAALLQVLVPMYIEVTLLRSLYESIASELGARMTAMDSATKNANEMILNLTLQYNRARQAAITTELMEIIGGAEALNA